MIGQAQAGSEPVDEPRTIEPRAFYTVTTKNKEGQFKQKENKKHAKGGCLCFGKCPWLILDYRLSCIPNITAGALSCRFALFNIRRIQSFLTKDATQLLVQALITSHLDYCNPLLARLPACMTKLLQRIWNAAVCIVFSLPKLSYVTPPLWGFLLLPVSYSRWWYWLSRPLMELYPST